MANTLHRGAPAATFLTHYFGGGLVALGHPWHAPHPRRAHGLSAHALAGLSRC